MKKKKALKNMKEMKSYLVIKVREVKIVKELKKVMACAILLQWRCFSVCSVCVLPGWKLSRLLGQ